MRELTFSFNTSGVKSFCPLKITVKVSSEGTEVIKAEWMGRDVLQKITQNERAWVEYQAQQELRNMKKESI